MLVGKKVPDISNVARSYGNACMLRSFQGFRARKEIYYYEDEVQDGRALPSLSEFLYICDYLGVTPMEFFDTSSTSPLLAHELSELTKDMCKEDLEALITMAKRIKAK